MTERCSSQGIMRASSVVPPRFTRAGRSTSRSTPAAPWAPTRGAQTGSPDMGGYVPRHRRHPGGHAGPGGRRRRGEGGAEFAPTVMRTLQEASALAARGAKAAGPRKYKSVLATDPAHPEALAWVEDYLARSGIRVSFARSHAGGARRPTSSETRKQQAPRRGGAVREQRAISKRRFSVEANLFHRSRRRDGARAPAPLARAAAGAWTSLAALSRDRRRWSTTDAEARSP